MDELLGFAVLTGPLLPILMWLVVSIVVVVFIINPAGSIIRRITIKFIFFVIIFVMPIGDEIIGRIYHGYLCANKSGYKVYMTAGLPADNWDENRNQKYLSSNGFVDMNMLPERYGWKRINEKQIDFIIKITKSRAQLIDNYTKNVLGEQITYIRKYGWLNRFSISPSTGESCRDLSGERDREILHQKEAEKERAFFQDIFKPITSD